MKKNLFYLSLILTASILLSSCNATMMKRHYRKGYYVEHKHKPKTEKTNLAVENKEAVAVKSVPALPQVSSEPAKLEMNNSDEPSLKESHHSKKSFAKNSDESSFLNTDEKKNEAGFLRSKVNKAKVTAEKVMGPEGGLIAATLSLFWIIIVVLLVLYLIGIVFEGFGLGGLFHLMALIILILLILWLLGVV